MPQTDALGPLLGKAGDEGVAGEAIGVLESCKRERVKVDSGSLIYADRNVYSVSSRLIGEQVEARLYMDRVGIWLL